MQDIPGVHATSHGFGLRHVKPARTHTPKYHTYEILIFCFTILYPKKRVQLDMQQDSGVVQDIKFGVRLVAGAVKNSTHGHKSPRRVPADDVKAAEEAKSTDGPSGDAAVAAAAATKGARSLPALHLEVSRASAGAIDAVEAQGGTVTCVHFNRLALRALVSRACGSFSC